MAADRLKDAGYLMKSPLGYGKVGMINRSLCILHLFWQDFKLRRKRLLLIPDVHTLCKLMYCGNRNLSVKYCLICFLDMMCGTHQVVIESPVVGNE